MTRPQQRLLSQLASSPNELASGLGQCLEALRLISALPRASPVFVHYATAASPTIKAFGRDHLSRVPLRTVITLIKASLALSDPVRITSALFYREDGSIDPTPVLVDEDSWKEIAPYVHTLHVEDDVERPSTARSTVSGLSVSGTVISIGNGTASSGMGVGVGMGLGTGVGSGKVSGLNSSATAFIPSPNAISIKTNEGGKTTGLLGSRRPSFSPSSPQPSSPFAILQLDNTGACV